MQYPIPICESTRMTTNDNCLLFDPDDIRIIRMLCSPIQSYAVDEYSPKYPSYVFVNLKSGDCIEISAIESSFGEKFDCFTLKFSITDSEPDRSHRVHGLSIHNQVFVLMREEWLEPFTGNGSTLVGINPVTQNSGRAGSAAQDAFNKGIVAAGILVSGNDRSKIVIITDIFPATVRVFVEENDINTVMAMHDKLTLDSYLARFSQSAGSDPEC